MARGARRALIRDVNSGGLSWQTTAEPINNLYLITARLSAPWSDRRYRNHRLSLPSLCQLEEDSTLKSATTLTSALMVEHFYVTFSDPGCYVILLLLYLIALTIKTTGHQWFWIYEYVIFIYCYIKLNLSNSLLTTLHSCCESVDSVFETSCGRTYKEKQTPLNTWVISVTSVTKSKTGRQCTSFTLR